MNISEFKLLLAKSEFTPKEILEVLAKDKDWRVRAVQMNQKNL